MTNLTRYFLEPSARLNIGPLSAPLRQPLVQRLPHSRRPREADWHPEASDHAAGQPRVGDAARARLSIHYMLHVGQFAFLQKPGEDRAEGRENASTGACVRVCVLCMRVEASVDRGHLMSYN